MFFCLLGICPWFCTKCTGFSDEWWTWDSQKLSVENCPPSRMGKEGRPLQAWRGSDASELQGASWSYPENWYSSCGFWRECNREGGTCWFWFLVDLPPSCLHKIYRGYNVGRNSRLSKGNETCASFMSIGGVWHLSDFAMCWWMLYDRSKNGKIDEVRDISWICSLFHSICSFSFI